MKVKASRIRHPLACFKGEISVDGERTAHAEEIKLAFDYFPVIDAQDESNAGDLATDETLRNGSNGRKQEKMSYEEF